MNDGERFSPDWASAPGDTIGDILQERDISSTDFADLIGFTPGEKDNLIAGRTHISDTVARRLSEALGASVRFWLAREFSYREDIGRLDAAGREWLGELPLRDMINFGWLGPAPQPDEEVDACLGFFDELSVLGWRRTYASLQEVAAFRTSSSFASVAGSVATWLRQGEIEARGIECGPWNPTRFARTLDHIRGLTREKDPDRFIPRLQTACAADGVAVVVVRAPSGCRASGAVRFISRDKAVLQLSFRYLTDDHFWFTFFHESGHLLLHGTTLRPPDAARQTRSWILEARDAPHSKEEEEANRFAAHTLVPADLRRELSQLPLNHRAVIRFAQRVGVSPGIIVGQLQHAGRIEHSQMNALKRRFAWSD